MSALIQKIEKKWVENFKRSPLIEKETGKYLIRVAHQLYYGKLDESYPSNYPHDFVKLYDSYYSLEKEEIISEVIKFLFFIGIIIQKVNVDNHLDKFPDELPKLLKKCNFILKALAHYNNTININNPYLDNAGDIYFLAKIESTESLKGGQLHLFDDIELPELYKRLSSIPDGYEDDTIAMDLFHRLENGNESIFITGKAGTGKSTFLHYFTQKTRKNVLMTAFTGIAAINIGGQTLHSFFNFPLKPLMPEDDEIPIFNKYSEKVKMIEKIDTIVIDEVSMLRSDLLQAIDFSLRKNGGNPNKFFGGKQLIFVGDIFQLPPVLNDDIEGIKYTEMYESEYFFDALPYKNINPSYFEFKKSFRQKDDIEFVKLLDKVRLCKVDPIVIEKINERCNPSYTPKIDEFIINLTSTNKLANDENFLRLKELPYTQYNFQAQIQGEFSDQKFPASRVLELKRNSQVVFIKNDQKRRWVNGTIAKIDFISHDVIDVRLQDGSVHTIEKATWENRKYKYDKEKGKIASTVVGTFIQFPIKLAWAITIHKSQGLTFDRVIIDLGTGAFVNGQVYTALSRCRTFNEIYLRQKLRQEDIISDIRIINFHETEQILQSLDDTDE